MKSCLGATDESDSDSDGERNWGRDSVQAEQLAKELDALREQMVEDDWLDEDSATDDEGGKKGTLMDDQIVAASTPTKRKADEVTRGEVEDEGEAKKTKTC